MTHDKKKSILKDILLLYFSILFLWTGYRMFFSFPEWVDEFIAKPILWIGPFIYIQKKHFNVLTFKRLNGTMWLRNMIFGTFVGILYFVGYTLLSYFSRELPSANPDHLPVSGLMVQFLIAISTAFVEELIFRRYILEKSLYIFNDHITANSFTTLLFTFIHIPIIVIVYKYSLSATLSYLSLIGISGYIYGVVYLKNKSFLASTMTHALWNFLGTIIR